MADKDTVAVLGAGGTMGFAIARKLARAGFEVLAWNRSREKAEPLAADGATVVGTPAAAAAGARVVITMLADGDAVVACAHEAFGGGRGDGRVWLQASTIGEDGTERCIALGREHGVTLVDAPVLGTKQPAEQGELVILASGPGEVRERLAPILDTVGRRTMWVGEAGAGTRLKVATNSWILAVMEGCAETIALAEGVGLDPHLVLEAVAGGPLDMPYLQVKAEAIMRRRFEPSFRLSLAAKDAALAEQAAARRHLSLPLLSTIRARMEEGARAHGDEDMAATYLTSAPEGAPA